MLVLSRKVGERIFIGESICVTVVDIDRGKVRLGITAPRDVPINREELLGVGHHKHSKEDVDAGFTKQVEGTEGQGSSAEAAG